MKIFGIGVDIIENKRFKKLLNNKRFINRICSPKEYRVLRKKRNKVLFLSKRFSDLNYGDHRITLDLNDLNGFPIGSGVYFIQLESSKEQAIKKCIILRN